MSAENHPAVSAEPFIIKRLPIGFFGKSGYRERMF